MLTAKTLIDRVLAREDAIGVGIDPVARGVAMRRAEHRLFQEMKNVNEPRMEDDPRVFAQEATASLFKGPMTLNDAGLRPSVRVDVPKLADEPQMPGASDEFGLTGNAAVLAQQFSNEGSGDVPVSVIATALAHRLGTVPEAPAIWLDDDDFVFNLKQ